VGGLVIVMAFGVTGGLWSGGIRFGLPGDQRPDETFSLVYTSAPLEEDLAIIGWPRVRLHVSSTASVVGFAASLCDVAPTGVSHLVAKGMLNATRRDSFSEPSPLEPERVYELDIAIDATGWIFRKGQRIRLNIASADWPNVWPTPEPAVNRIHRGADHPSRLILPVIPLKGSATPPVFRPSETPVEPHTAAASPPVWEAVHDLLGGRESVRIQSTGGYRVDERTAIQRDFSLVTDLHPDDPAHVVARGLHVSRLTRPGETIEGRSETAIRSTATHLHVSIDLDVRLNGALHFQRRWVESIPRHLL
jgi:hypothetical protein